jgi:hypothetical protein
MSSDVNVSPLNWDEAGEEWQTTPSDNPVILPAVPSNLEKLKGACGRAFACTCGTGGGFLVSHIGCLVSPTLSFMGAATGASLSAVSMGVSAGLTGLGLGFWYVYRGHKAQKLEKVLTAGGAAAGMALALTMHLSGIFGHNHNLDEALEWYRNLPETTQTEMQEGAIARGVALQDYVLDICGSFGTSNLEDVSPEQIEEAVEQQAAQPRLTLDKS